MILQSTAAATSAATAAPLFPHHSHGGGISSSFFHSVPFPSGFSGSALLKPPTSSKTASSVAITCGVKSKYRGRGTVDYEQRPTAPWLLIFRSLTSMPSDSDKGAAAVLNQFDNEGKRISKFCLSRVVKELRKSKRFKLALEVYNWMNKRPESFWMSTSDLAIQLDLTCKVYGIQCAENFFKMLSNSVKDVRVYGALLNAYVHARMKEKAESLFDEMREKCFLCNPLQFNVMMSLYVKLKEYDKVDSIVSEMIENSIQLDAYSYNIWLSALGYRGYMEQMEQTFYKMKADPTIDLGLSTYNTLATMYIKMGQFEKAEDCLKQIESRFLGQGHTPFHYLISLYGNIGKKEEVHRIWNLYKSNFLKISNMSYRGVVSSLVRAGDIEGAEKIYEEWLSTASKYDIRIGTSLLGCYVRNGLPEKAEALFNQMIENGEKLNSKTWEILAEYHMKAKRISKALSCLKEAVSVERSKNWRPRPSVIASILVHCEQENDVASKELLFEVLKQGGYLDDEKYMSICNKKVNRIESGKDDRNDDDDEESNEGAELLLLNQL